jgi:L-lactate utilization protein LutC
MSEARERFLQRVREAVSAGNRVGEYPTTIPDRGTTGHQGTWPDPVARFTQELRGAGGFVHPVIGMEAARTTVTDLLRRMKPRSVLLGRWKLPEELAAERLIRDVGATVLDADQVPATEALGEFATTDVGLTGCDHLIAETGSVVVRSRSEQPRTLSLLPPFHIVVATATQILHDVFDLFALTEGRPSAMALITGPSKTGDIEGQLVTGVHGPGELHVVVVGGD